MYLTEGVKDILSRLHNAGYEAYVVGGAVRNHFIGIPTEDYDITTSATPDEIFEVFLDYNTFAPGLKHGTVCVERDKTVYEITTFRTESGYADNRHPTSVDFVRNLKEDLSRRDFTVNAICYDGKDFVDEFGGRQDILDGVIRCIGNAEERFNEDALRILRALRFASRLGFSIEENTKSAIFARKRLLNNVSAERIRAELEGILCGKNVFNVLMEYKDVFTQILPELKPCFDFGQRSIYHVYDVYEHMVRACAYIKPLPTLRMAALLHDIGKPKCFSVGEDGIGHFYGHAKRSVTIAADILDRLKFSVADKRAVLALIEYHDYPLISDTDEQTDNAILRLLNKLGKRGFFDIVEIKKADNFAKSEAVRSRLGVLDGIRQRAEELIEKQDACFTLKQLAVTGDDIIALGGKGKEIGVVLNGLLDSVISGKPNDREELLALAKKKLDFLNK